MEEEKNIKTKINEGKGLILGRRPGEKILIGKSVQIEVLKFDRGSVTLSIKAPKNIPVYRQEVFEETVKQNKKAIKKDIAILKKVLTGIKIVDKNAKD
ncbi:MAG: carbon storage regulator [Bacteroidetes bacterium]|nr:carbon storage regulator [Bacteroidota bacterium]